MEIKTGDNGSELKNVYVFWSSLL